MEYLVQDIVKAVRVALDENKSSESLIKEADIDTLTLDEIIESKIVDAATVITLSAPNYLLDGGKPFGESIVWQSHVGCGAGHIYLPEDFLRLVSFQMSDWSYPVTIAITDTDPAYQMQFSRFAGIKGNPQKPVVAIISQAGGKVLQFFSCTQGEGVYVKQASYIAVPKIHEDKIDLSERLRSAVVYYAAHLVASSLNDANTATTMLNISKELLQ